MCQSHHENAGARQADVVVRKALAKIDIIAAVVALAVRQHGCVTRAQLLELGVAARTIGEWIRRGRLFPVHAGVYAVGRPLTTPVERAAAAVLACGFDALLSHFSALAAWGLVLRWPAIPEVTVGRRRRRPGMVIHHSRCLSGADIRVQLGIRATSPARTLLDCAPQLSTTQLTRTLADARRHGLLHAAQLDDALARHLNHPGRPLIRAIRDDTQAPTRSAFEDLFPAFCERHGLPAPLINVSVNGREVDAYFPAEGVIVELDGWEFHRDRGVFESDRDHDADALAVDLVTYRMTWDRLIGDPAREARRLTAVLATRRRRAA